MVDTDTILKILNNYLKIVVENNDKCKKCMHNMYYGCFLASECVANNFDYYEEEVNKNDC